MEVELVLDFLCMVFISLVLMMLVGNVMML